MMSKAAVIASIVLLVPEVVAVGTRGAALTLPINQARTLQEADIPGLGQLVGLVTNALGDVASSTTVPVPLPEGEALNIPGLAIPTGLPGFDLEALSGLGAGIGAEFPSVSVPVDVLGVTTEDLPGVAVPIPGPGITLSTPEGTEGDDEEAPVAEGIPELGEAAEEGLPVELSGLEEDGSGGSDPEDLLDENGLQGLLTNGEPDSASTAGAVGSTKAAADGKLGDSSTILPESDPEDMLGGSETLNTTEGPELNTTEDNELNHEGNLGSLETAEESSPTNPSTTSASEGLALLLGALGLGTLEAAGVIGNSTESDGPEDITSEGNLGSLESSEESSPTIPMSTSASEGLALPLGELGVGTLEAAGVIGNSTESDGPEDINPEGNLGSLETPEQSSPTDPSTTTFASEGLALLLGALGLGTLEAAGVIGNSTESDSPEDVLDQVVDPISSEVDNLDVEGIVDSVENPESSELDDFDPEDSATDNSLLTVAAEGLPLLLGALGIPLFEQGGSPEGGSPPPPAQGIEAAESSEVGGLEKQVFGGLEMPPGFGAPEGVEDGLETAESYENNEAGSLEGSLEASVLPLEFGESNELNFEGNTESSIEGVPSPASASLNARAPKFPSDNDELGSIENPASSSSGGNPEDTLLGEGGSSEPSEIGDLPSSFLEALGIPALEVPETVESGALIPEGVATELEEPNSSQEGAALIPEGILGEAENPEVPEIGESLLGETPEDVEDAGGSQMEESQILNIFSVRRRPARFHSGRRSQT